MDPNTLFLLIIGGASGYAAVRRFWPRRATMDQAEPFVRQCEPGAAQSGADDQERAPQGAPSWLGSTPRQTTVARVRLSALARLDNVAIIGPKGSGKTTILRTIAGLRQGEQLAFDPDNSPGKWPGLTVGGGSQFGNIAVAFARLDTAMTARSVELDAGRVADEAFPLRTLISDEFYAISTELKTRQRGDKDAPPDVGALLLRRIVRGRKYRDCVLCATHNDTLLGLGLPDGAADMKSCFDAFVYLGAMVRLRCKDEAVRDAALTMGHPAVVFDTERGFWFVLEVDVPLMTKERRFPPRNDAGLARSLSSVRPSENAGGVFEPESAGTDGRTKDGPRTDDGPSIDRERLARALMRHGVSRDTMRAAMNDLGLGFANKEYTRWSEETGDQATRQLP